ncbi:MAG TPA: peptidylprolyl isomerase [Patescibacteria group bacterium]|nr:peptidylprolyl isomerase [Patescibacteria group bacterium]
MTFRARPTTRAGRRSGHESGHRRNLYFNVGFGGVVVLALLLLGGAVAASWYDEHLAAVAVVNGETITKDALRDRVAEETFRLGILESRTREKVTAGRMSPSQGQQFLNEIARLQEQAAGLAYERAIDTTLLLQLAADRGIQVTEAEIDAQLTKDATTPESRHTFQIQVIPETSAGATEPTPAQQEAARTKAEGLLADLEGGKTWEEVVAASGDADAAETNGDLFFIDEGSTSPDVPFVEAIFALPAPGFTDVIEGEDGVFRIGRMTEIAAAVVDPNHLRRAADAGVSEQAYRSSAQSVVARDRMTAQILAEVVDRPSEQRRTVEIAIEGNDGSPIAPGAVLVKHLLYSPNNDPGGAAALPADDPAWAAAEAEARQAHADLAAGTQRFVDLAVGSDDATSAAANGFLPYFAEDDPAVQLDQAFADAIFAEGLAPGQLLAPVKSAFGWHVIEFVSAEDPVIRSQRLIGEAGRPGADLAQLAADHSIAPSAADGGDIGWIARHQLEWETENAIFATQLNGVSAALPGDGLVFYVVTEIATRLPDPDQARTLRENAFINWYQGIKNDPARTTIERLLDTSATG